MSFTNFGGRIISLSVPDRAGKFDDVVLGYDSLADYLKDNPYFGSMIGRYANRIAGGKFTLDGKTWQLPVNNGPNTLHSGPLGYHNVYWNVHVLPGDAAAELTYLSKDGEQGFPGNLDIKVTYTLTDDNELTIDYEATTDQTTVVNLTDHSYFNLLGAGNGDILGHELMINADRYCPVDTTSIPTGALRPVKGTPFDFSTSRTIGELINAADEQLTIGKGYDHSYVLNKDSGEYSLALRLREPTSGRVMELWTTDIGFQFYTGNFLDGSLIGKGGKPYNYRSAVCTETQHLPDSPNKPEFPSVVLKVGENYKKKTGYRFGVE